MRHRLKFLDFLLIVVFIFSFTGCTTAAVATATTADAEKMAVAETTATPIPAPKTQTYFFEGRVFSDDVAWVLRSKPENWNDPGGGWECIDDKGNTLFKLEENSFPLTDFIDGAASITTKNSDNEEIDKIINKSGKVIFPKDDSYKYRYLISYGAYTFVSRNINTVEKTEEQAGIVDNTGKWVIEPTPDLSVAINPSASFFEHGIIKVMYQGNDFYDANSNEFFKSSIAQGNEDNYLELAHRLVENSYKEDLCFLTEYNDDGTLYFPGLSFIMGSGPDLTKLGFNNKGTGFYDRNKNMAIDLSSYQDAEALGGFSDGFCSVMLKNPQGNIFYTVIDNKGNQMFEPIPSSNYPPIMKISCGRIYVNGKGYYIDVNGKTVIPSVQQSRSGSTFSDKGFNPVFSENGLAKVYVINTETQLEVLYFIDTDGNIAF